MILLWIVIVLMAGMVVIFIFSPLLKTTSRQELPHRKFLLLGTASAFVAASMGLYFLWGGSASLHEFMVRQQLLAKAERLLKKMSSPEDVIKALKAKLIVEPNSAKGWYLLGKLYLGSQHYGASCSAFAKAHELAPDDLEITYQFALALYLRDQQLNVQAKELLQQIVKKDPEQVSALNLLAMDALHTHRYHDAIRLWQKILAFLPEEASQDKEQILKMIEQAERALNKP